MQGKEKSKKTRNIIEYKPRLNKKGYVSKISNGVEHNKNAADEKDYNTAQNQLRNYKLRHQSPKMDLVNHGQQKYLGPCDGSHTS